MLHVGRDLCLHFGESFASDGQDCVRWYDFGYLWKACLMMVRFVFLSCLLFGGDILLLKGEKLKVFPLRLGRRQKCSFAPLLFNINFGSPTYCNLRRNERNPDCKNKKEDCHCFQMK